MLSLVVPVYRNEATLPELLGQIAGLAGQLDEPLEVVFVVDGSPDNSYTLLKQRLPTAPLTSQLVALSRNFGPFAAIRMGLSIARGRQMAVLTADLQQPVESVRDFFTALAEGADIVLGQRAGRSDPWISRLFSTTFWWFYRRFIQPEVPRGGVDVFACTSAVRDVLVRLPESNSSLVGLLLWVGFTRRAVPYRRNRRPRGHSGWTFRRKLRYFLDSVFAFSDLPINLLLVSGAFGVIASVVVAALVVLAWWSGRMPVVGYTPLMLVLLCSFSATLFALGVIGAYIWRVFENTKQRPPYIPVSVEVFDRPAR